MSLLEKLSVVIMVGCVWLLTTMLLRGIIYCAADKIFAALRERKENK